MPVLPRDGLEQAPRTTPEERARQALDPDQAGYRLKRAALRTRAPHASEAEIDAQLRRWLEGDDGA